MAFSYERLTEITTMTSTAPTAILTNTSGEKRYVRLIIIHNPSTAAATATLWNVPDSTGTVGVAADANKFYSASIASSGTEQLEYAVPGIILSDTNDTIQAQASIATMTVQIYGGKE
jgi:hypothetical protein